MMTLSVQPLRVLLSFAFIFVLTSVSFAGGKLCDVEYRFNGAERSAIAHLDFESVEGAVVLRIFSEAVCEYYELTIPHADVISFDIVSKQRATDLEVDWAKRKAARDAEARAAAEVRKLKRERERARRALDTPSSANEKSRIPIGGKKHVTVAIPSRAETMKTLGEELDPVVDVLTQVSDARESILGNGRALRSTATNPLVHRAVVELVGDVSTHDRDFERVRKSVEFEVRRRRQLSDLVATDHIDAKTLAARAETSFDRLGRNGEKLRDLAERYGDYGRRLAELEAQSKAIAVAEAAAVPVDDRSTVATRAVRRERSTDSGSRATHRHTASEQAKPAGSARSDDVAERSVDDESDSESDAVATSLPGSRAGDYWVAAVAAVIGFVGAFLMVASRFNRRAASFANQPEAVSQFSD